MLSTLIHFVTDKEETETIPFKALLRPFNDISGNSGVSGIINKCNCLYIS